jgi:hypothetical protein
MPTLPSKLLTPAELVFLRDLLVDIMSEIEAIQEEYGEDYLSEAPAMCNSALQILSTEEAA